MESEIWRRGVWGEEEMVDWRMEDEGYESIKKIKF